MSKQINENTNKPDIKIVTPTVDDLDAVLAVENAAWPPVGKGMVAEPEKFKIRLELGLMHMLYFNGNPAGIISFQSPSFTCASTLETVMEEYEEKQGLLDWNMLKEKYSLPQDWYTATNNGFIKNNEGAKYNSTHNPHSDCAFFIGVGVNHALKGHGLVNYLIQTALKTAAKSGKRYALAYGRLPQLCETYPHKIKVTIEEAQEHLLKKKPNTNLPLDYGARFHVLNGAKAVAVIPDAMEDSESCNYGFLALYKLTG
ncbi:MAG: hypothetical protein WC254_01275 [Candidatus Woesearchaeota archaeon]|jgi:hypothetical protein